MKALEITPLEPPVFSRSPIPSPDMISAPIPSPSPLPTTVAGMIGSILGVKLENLGKLFGLEELYRKLKIFCIDPVFKGPAVMFNSISDDIYIPAGGSRFAPISRIKRFEDIYYLDLSGKGSPIVVGIESERIGVKLLRGYMGLDKVVDKGYMYRYSVTIYKTIDGKNVTPTFIYILNCDIDDRDLITRLGGEGRVFRILIRDLGERVGKIANKFFTPIEKIDHGLYILVSPSPLIQTHVKTASPDIPRISNLLGSEYIEEIVGLLPNIKSPEELEMIRSKRISIKKRIERLNLGYSEAFNMRRPQILAIPPGTVIKARMPMKANDLVRVLWGLGFSTIFKLD